MDLYIMRCLTKSAPCSLNMLQPWGEREARVLHRQAEELQTGSALSVSPPSREVVHLQYFFRLFQSLKATGKAVRKEQNTPNSLIKITNS